MKKVPIPAFTFCCFLLGSLLCSFKGDSEEGKISSRIVGTWRTIAEGDDINSNDIWDEEEHNAVPLSNSATMRFFTDGSGTTSGLVGDSTMTLKFKWDLQDSDQDMRVVCALMEFIDTSVYHIVSITESEFVMRNLSKKSMHYVSMRRL